MGMTNEQAKAILTTRQVKSLSKEESSGSARPASTGYGKHMITATGVDKGLVKMGYFTNPSYTEGSTDESGGAERNKYGSRSSIGTGESEGCVSG